MLILTKEYVELKKGKLYVIEGKTIKNQEVTLKVINYSDKAGIRGYYQKIETLTLLFMI